MGKWKEGFAFLIPISVFILDEPVLPIAFNYRGVLSVTFGLLNTRKCLLSKRLTELLGDSEVYFHLLCRFLGGIDVPTDPKHGLQFIHVDLQSIKIATRDMLSTADCRSSQSTLSKTLLSQWTKKQIT